MVVLTNFRHFTKSQISMAGKLRTQLARGYASFGSSCLRWMLHLSARCTFLASGSDMVRTGVLLPSEEHFLAYMLSGLLVAAAMPRYRFVHVACFYVLLAAMLELGQNFVPGRDPEAFTAFVSMCGAMVGEVVARLISGSWRERFGLASSAVAASTVRSATK